MANVEWVAPALAWAPQANINALRAPRILEIRSDDFMEEFLQAMRSEAPHTYIQNRQMTPQGGRLKLFQPLHGCYYLVTASLVCRQIGLPDREVKRNQGESTGFVIRRRIGNVEEGWVNEGDTRGWNAVDAHHLVAEEEILPLNPLTVCTDHVPALAAYRMRGNCERTIYHGYLPVGNRDKYTATKKFTPDAGQTNAELFSTYLTEVRNDDTSNVEDAEGGFRASEFDTRVIGPWTAHNTLPATPDPKDLQRRVQAAYYIVVDLADFVHRALPDIWAALIKFYAGEPNPKAGVGGNQLILLDRLLNEDNQVAWNVANGNELGLAMFNVRSVVETESAFMLPVSGSVPANYTLGTLPGTLKTLMISALGETPPTQMQVSNEFAELLREQVRVPTPEVNVRYYIRLVYRHDPECPPHISEPSPDIQFARFFDGEAPARKIRIEAPQLQDLRKFKPGVGIQMDKDMRDLINRVHEGLKDGDPLDSGSVNWELGMICSFSIQIVFMVAFIVMFIFLILLNIVFWWLPFLKICLPIPKPK